MIEDNRPTLMQCVKSALVLGFLMFLAVGVIAIFALRDYHSSKDECLDYGRRTDSEVEFVDNFPYNWSCQETHIMKLAPFRADEQGNEL